jgi:hypothetical protein
MSELIKKFKRIEIERKGMMQNFKNNRSFILKRKNGIIGIAMSGLNTKEKPKRMPVNIFGVFSLLK